MDADLRALGEDLVTTAARVVRWAPKTGITLSLAASRILLRLHDAGPIRIGDLASLEGSSQPTVTNHVKRLEAAGLVLRHTDPSDARAWMIEISEAGRAELAAMRRCLGANLEPHLAELPTAELEALQAGLAAMRRLMGTR